jgi:hypothetical protein
MIMSFAYYWEALVSMNCLQVLCDLCMSLIRSVRCVQVKEDVYEKIDKELLEYVEDVLLNRCENATERLLEFAATLDPKSKPCKVVRKGGAPVLKLSKKVPHFLHVLSALLQTHMQHNVSSDKLSAALPTCEPSAG